MTNTLDISAILVADLYPHSATLPLGGGHKLEITYRSPRPNAQEKVKQAVADDLTALGLDPDALFRVLGGESLVGEDLIRMEEAAERLQADGAQRLRDVIQKAQGASVAHLIGAWNLTDGGESVPVTAETCGRLPEEIQRTVVKLAREVTLPVEKAGFSAGSARS